jgi:hypothetical protein
LIKEKKGEKIVNLIEEKKLVQKKFEDELRIIYGATLLSADPSGYFATLRDIPYFNGWDKEAAVSALEDISHA